jgi:hypothetical protein
MIDIPIPMVRLRPSDEPQTAATIQPTMQPISYIETTVDIVSASVAFEGQLKLNRVTAADTVTCLQVDCLEEIGSRDDTPHDALVIT